MPPHDFDYGNLTFAVTDQDGRQITLTPAEYFEEPVNAKTLYFAQAICADGEFSITTKIRNMRGALDCLTGFTFTKAARRFIRSQKRRIEKNRRKKLKERGLV